jgi:hypothetical protein
MGRAASLLTPRTGSLHSPARCLRAVLLLAAAAASHAQHVHTPRPASPPPAPKFFATSIRCASITPRRPYLAERALTLAARSGEGGPPIQDTPVGTPGTSTMTLYYLNEIDPLATCNDGASAVQPAHCARPASGRL